MVADIDPSNMVLSAFIRAIRGKISPFPPLPPVKSDAGVSLGSPSASIRGIRGKIIFSALRPPVKFIADLVAAPPRRVIRDCKVSIRRLPTRNRRPAQKLVAADLRQAPSS
jgi:hypothetical protein